MMPSATKSEITLCSLTDVGCKLRLGSGAGLHAIGYIAQWHQPDPRPMRTPQRTLPWLGTKRLLFPVLAYLTEAIAHGTGPPTPQGVKIVNM